MAIRGGLRYLFTMSSFVMLAAGGWSQNARAPQPQSPTATITREQADEILNELRQIRRLLEVNGRPAAAPQRPAQPPAPRNIRMTVTPGWQVMGREDAPVTLVEFMDYQCPYCRRFHTDTFTELKRQYIDTGKLRFVSRDLPLSFHPNALSAAQAARCAGEQGKYWEVREALITHADDLALESLVRHAQEAGANAEQLRACVVSEKYRAEVQKEAAEAAALAISGTPSFLVAKTSAQELNGELIRGAVPLAVFEAAIKKLLDGATAPAVGVEQR